MTGRSFTFQDQMRMSEGVSESDEINIEKIILSNFPTAEKVARANTSDDKNGTDYWVTMQSGQRASVDVKVRAEDWLKHHPGQDDVALETWSVIGAKVGWTRDVQKRTDYILFIWLETGRWMLIPFPVLCSIFVKNWEEWRKKYKARPQFTRNPNGSHWYSECVFVPRALIWKEYYSAFGGALHA